MAILDLPYIYWRPCRQYIIEKLEVGKWIFLWVVLGEAISLGLALVMRLMGNLEGKYENMELEEAYRLHNPELQGISKSMTAQQKITNKNEDRQLSLPPLAALWKAIGTLHFC